MARYPQLLRPLWDRVFLRELARGEQRLRGLTDSGRILRDLNADQISQLAGLLVDAMEAVDCHTSRRRSSQVAQRLAGEADRRARMLSRKTLKLRSELEKLRDYAQGLHPLLGLRYAKATDRCLDILSRLREDPFALEVARSLKDEYPTLENPGQLAMVQLYWFFRHECRCTGTESQVRVAMVMNDLLACNLAYIPTGADEGCPAVRQAVLRYRPLTTS